MPTLRMLSSTVAKTTSPDFFAQRHYNNRVSRQHSFSYNPWPIFAILDLCLAERGPLLDVSVFHMVTIHLCPED